MKIILIAFLLGTFFSTTNPSSVIGPGQQPQLTVDPKGIIRLVYGQEDKIFYSVSSDDGTSFSKPMPIGDVHEMHLGMARGPQLASSNDYSIVTAIDKKGNIHSFQLNHKTKKWSKIKNVNNVEGSAPEGLMDIAADETNNFYAVWLDLREDKNNKIAFSTWTKSGSWSNNRIVYKSPDNTVCECCKPSVAVNGKNVSLMFRNWMKGSRDLYLISSSDEGVKFGDPTKLGSGTWKLKGCPMDGGGMVIDKSNVVHTVWQREGVVYYDQPGQSENRIAEGRSCNLFGGETPFVTWEEGDKLYGQTLNGKKINIGEGAALSVVQINGNKLLAVWEKDGEIVFKKLQ
jgi:hypothetical protein